MRGKAVGQGNVFSNGSGQERRNGIGYLLNLAADAADEMKGVGKCLETSALAKGQEPVFNRMDKFPCCGARYREARLVNKEPLEAGRGATSLLDRGAVHNATKGATTEGIMLQVLGKVLHRLAWLKAPNPIGLNLAQGKNEMLGDRFGAGAQVCLKLVGRRLGERDGCVWVRAGGREVSNRTGESSLAFAKDRTRKAGERFWENEVMAKPVADNEDSLAALGNPIALGVKFFKVDVVACAKQGLNSVPDVYAAAVREQAFNVFHYEPFRT